MPPDKVTTARQMYDSKEFTVEAIARVLSVSRASIYRHLTAVNGHRDLPTGGHENSPGTAARSPRGRPPGLPRDGHENSPRTVMSPLKGSGERHHPLAGESIG
jgi:hypothetical protein